MSPTASPYKKPHPPFRFGYSHPPQYTAAFALQRIDYEVPTLALRAIAWETAPSCLIRDRDGIYGNEFTRCVHSLGIKQVVTARRSPWQNGYVERVIGSIRRECTDHIIVFNENHLRRLLQSYIRYYHRSRTHLSLEKDAPEPRPVEPAENGQVVAFPEVGGLHHRYARRAA